MVEAAADLMGELPYRRYVFMHIGRGGGGLEHANSTAIAFDPSELDSAEAYRDWLSFVCHEYFHLFNVKRIRPLALGPFDYDRENYTRMLWVSEGISVYYEDLLLRRAGLITRDQLLDAFRKRIAGLREHPGASRSVRDRGELRHLAPSLCEGRERGQHDDLLLRQGRGARDAARSRDQARIGESGSRSTT